MADDCAQFPPTRLYFPRDLLYPAKNARRRKETKYSAASSLCPSHESLAYFVAFV